MALERGTNPRPISPGSSDGSAAHILKSRTKDQDGLLKKDKSYRRYAAGVERALSLFDTALQEWADYISFLGRLLKALQAHPAGLAVVPNKATVAKRLAQCLNPTLPSGVHQKTLEVYAYIFSLLQQDGLAHDLALYLPGVSSTLTFASLSVRPLFLSLIETHVSRLQTTALRPALKAIILALLPGVEDETSEDFERTLHILDGFKQLFNDNEVTRLNTSGQHGGQYFWQCLFLASITNPSRRMGVLAYLNRFLPKLGSHQGGTTHGTIEAARETQTLAINAVASPEPGLLVRCFATGLADDNSLIQRNFLDLLVTHLPLNSEVLQKRVSGDDLEMLVTAAAGVVLRRDMSLNRRLWTWFLGLETASVTTGDGSKHSESRNTDRDKDADVGPLDSQYFKRYGLRSLTQSITSMVATSSTLSSERARPFRVSLSLMDRWEVGGLVVPAVFLPLMRSVYDFGRLAASSERFNEVLRSASVFFDGVESSLIWSEILSLLHHTSPAETVLANLDLADFIITSFNVREEEMLLVHVPMVSLALMLELSSMGATLDHDISDSATRTSITQSSMLLLGKLIDMCSEHALVAVSATSALGPSPEGFTYQEGTMRKIQHFYEESLRTIDPIPAPFAPGELRDLILDQVGQLIEHALESDHVGPTLRIAAGCFIALLDKTSARNGTLRPTLKRAILAKVISPLSEDNSSLPFPVASAISSLVIALYSTSPDGTLMSFEEFQTLTPALVKHLWAHLSPSAPCFHVEAVQCLWQLHIVARQHRSVEAAIATTMIRQQTPTAFHTTIESNFKHFTVLWGHCVLISPTSTEGLNKSLVAETDKGSIQEDNNATMANAFHTMLGRPLLIVLDLLQDQSTDCYGAVREWIRSLSSSDRIFEILFAKLFASTRFKASDSSKQTNDDTDQCCYYMRTASNILSTLSDDGWSRLANSSLAVTNQLDTSKGFTREGSALDDTVPMTVQVALARTCLKILEEGVAVSELDSSRGNNQLQHQGLKVLRQLLEGRFAERLSDLGLEEKLLSLLASTLNSHNTFPQGAIMDTLLGALKVKISPHADAVRRQPPRHQKRISKDAGANSSRPSLNTETTETDSGSFKPPGPPPALMDCLIGGIKAPSSRGTLEKWISLLCECLPLYSGTIFQLMLQLVECFCEEVSNSFAELKAKFRDRADGSPNDTEKIILCLLNGLEYSLSKGHDRLVVDESILVSSRSPEAPQGFFGNMVSGVFSNEGNQIRNAVGNHRLTVILCFQDTVRTCYTIWSWCSSRRSSDSENIESLASLQHTSLKLKNRTRRILENLFTTEPLECLETVIEIWCKIPQAEYEAESSIILNLLQTLQGSGPRVTIPALFNAIYSRTSPSALDSYRKSSLTSNISEAQLVDFLVIYARTLEDDVLDEIWADCTAFLRDVLGNPFPHRSILPRLMEFVAVLGAKMENTNFGEEWKMRREIADLFVRLLAAIFTIKPLGFSQDSAPASNAEKSQIARRNPFDSSLVQTAPDDIVGILANTMSSFIAILGDSDRTATTMSNISLHIISPLFKSRLFPQNVSQSALSLLQQISKIPSAAKGWKKDLADAFNDPKFFQSPPELVKSHWLSLLRQWVLVDKDRLTEFMSRLTAPTSAGIVFGVGASTARLEADKKTQLNLRRIATLLIATETDTFVGNMAILQEKLESLSTATHISSPSSATRADLFMVLRALVLKTSSIHLASFWPMINAEMQEALSSATPAQQSEEYDGYALLQAAKLLDTLLLAGPDDFQLQEWLYITDTIDAIYRPDDWEPTALIDEVSQTLGHRNAPSTPHAGHGPDSQKGLRKPYLSSDHIRTMPKEDIVRRALRPFFDQLSIYAFESTYSLGVPDLEACKDDLLKDLFNEGTIES